MCVCGGGTILGRGKPGLFKGERGNEARIRTAGRLAEVGAIVAVPSPGAAGGAAVIHLQRARAIDSGRGTTGTSLSVSPPQLPKSQPRLSCPT